MAKRSNKKRNQKSLRRPRSAYNFFYKHQRPLIIQEFSGPTSLNESRKTNSASIESLLEVNSCAERKHRRTHGVINLQDLTKEIAKRWKEADDETKRFYKDLAKQDSLRYSREKEEKTISDFGLRNDQGSTPSTGYYPASHKTTGLDSSFVEEQWNMQDEFTPKVENILTDFGQQNNQEGTLITGYDSALNETTDLDTVSFVDEQWNSTTKYDEEVMDSIIFPHSYIMRDEFTPRPIERMMSDPEGILERQNYIAHVDAQFFVDILLNKTYA